MGGRRLVKTGGGTWLRLGLLAICFLGGLLFGQVVANQLGGSTAGELTDYLNGFFSLEPNWEPSAKVAVSTAVVYLRYPLLAFLLGFASVGAVLLPLTTAAYGFFLSFSVCCFTAAFGRGGVLLALAALGLRSFITLPCYFALAVPALEKSTALALLTLRPGGRIAPPVYDRTWWQRCGGVLGILAAGIAGDLFLTPRLLHWVLGIILP
jgi:stage II sporulation protein M